MIGGCGNEHLVAVAPKIAEHLGVGRQAAGADAEIQPSVQHVIEHRDLGSDARRMRVGQIDRPGAQANALRAVRQARQEHHAGSDVLRLVGGVLSDIGLREAEFIGQYEGLAVLAQCLPPILGERMDRHSEKSEMHGSASRGFRREIWE
jgi:hypothetical protein